MTPIRKAPRLSSARKARKLRALRRRDGNCCWLCGERVDWDAEPNSPMSPTIDHIVPRCNGGRNALANLRIAHQRCNELSGRALYESLPDLGHGLRPGAVAVLPSTQPQEDRS